MSRILACIAALIASGALGCEPPPRSSADGTPQPAIASVYRARCGGCHTRVEPGTRSREHLESAFGRHRLRLRLREDQWRDLVTYLAIPEAPPPAATAPPCLPAPLTPATSTTSTPISPDEKGSP